MQVHFFKQKLNHMLEGNLDNLIMQRFKLADTQYGSSN